MIYLDTHVAARLYAGMLEAFGPETRELLEGEELLVSPMVELELQYLCEVGKIAEGADGRGGAHGQARAAGVRPVVPAGGFPGP